MHIESIGFSFICESILSDREKDFILNTFKYFDISISQIKHEITKNEIISVQSLFYGYDVSHCSLVNDQNDFDNLVKVFTEIISDISQCKISSVILGSPSLRKIKFIDKRISDSIIDNRFRVLKSIAEKYEIVLYLEALPKLLCDYCNYHYNLIKLNERIHVDFATMIVNNETIDFLVQNISIIDRFHFSIPGYSYNFKDHPEVIEWSRFLISNQIPGVIEIQNRNDKLDLVNEVQWVLRNL
jgi:hypothetical protein